jgi:hypothetical protein
LCSRRATLSAWTSHRPKPPHRRPARPVAFGDASEKRNTPTGASAAACLPCSHLLKTTNFFTWASGHTPPRLIGAASGTRLISKVAPWNRPNRPRTCFLRKPGAFRRCGWSRLLRVEAGRCCWGGGNVLQPYPVDGLSHALPALRELGPCFGDGRICRLFEIQFPGSMRLMVYVSEDLRG